MVFERGFEPPTTSMSTKCSTPELPEQLFCRSIFYHKFLKLIFFYKNSQYFHNFTFNLGIEGV